MLPLFGRLSTSVLLALLTALSASAQPRATPPAGSERGAFLLTNVSPLEYGGFPLTFGSVQDARGVLYVAGDDGVMEYDGVTWRTIALDDTRPRALALARDAAGTVFVGANDDLGYLAPDETGQMRFVSLRDRLAEASAPDPLPPFFAEYVHATSDGIVFNLRSHLVRWSGARFEQIGPAGSPTRAASADTAITLGESTTVDGRVLVGTMDGVMEVRGDELVMLPGTEPLAGDFVGAARLDERTRLLVGKRRVWRYADGTLSPFTDGEALGAASWFSSFVGLPDGGFVAGTTYDGLRYIDAEGRAGWALGEDEGLQDDEIEHLHVGADGHLYVSLLNGFAHLDPMPALSYFDKTTGLGGQMDLLVRHTGAIYAGTSTGLYRLASTGAPGRPARFEDALGSEAYVFDLRPHDGRLLAATGRGLFDLTTGRAEPVGVVADVGNDAVATYALATGPSVMPEGPATLLVGIGEVILSRYYDARAASWSAPDTLATLARGVDDFVQRSPRRHWASLYPEGLARLVFPEPGSPAPPRVEEFAPGDAGLPASRLFPFVLDGTVFVQSESGVFRYDDARHHFTPDSTFGAAFATGARRFMRPVVTSGALWSSSTTGPTESIRYHRIASPEDGRYAEDLPDAMRLIPPTIGWAFLEEPATPQHRAVVWSATTDRIYRYDASRAREPHASTPLVRRVTLGDSLLAHGSAPSAAAPTLPPRHSTLRFAFALPQLAAPERTRYSTMLDGFDADWSAWTHETQRDYTNLPGGDYRFLVRATDVYGRVSEAAPYAFTVRPPWYLTAWALLLFALVGIAGIAGVVHWRVASLNERARDLERTVAERTATITQQAEELRVLDEAKSRFFANVSHELRTPLALITGPLAELRARPAELPDAARDALAVMERNGLRLGGLVDQILNLTQIEAGVLQLDLAPRDLVAFVHFQTGLYDGLAQHRGVALAWEPDAVQSDAAPIVAAFDPDAVSKVLSNLIGNALKFTPRGGEVTVRVRTGDGLAHVNVQDTGIGISPDALPHVFDRFYQADDSRTRGYEGTGIGLSLARELAALHGGALEALSTPGEGSTFILSLPLSDAEPIDATEAETADSERMHLEAVLLDTSLDTSTDRTEAIGKAANDLDPADGQDADLTSELDRTTVLVVEDNADLRAFIRSVLEPDFRVLDARDGIEGLGLANEALPDLIVTDVMMPRMDGFTLAAELHSTPDTASIPVVALTARATQSDHIEGLRTGVDAYLTKPFDAEVLRLQVRNLIARQHRLRDLIRSRARTADTVTIAPDAAAPSDALSSESGFVRDVRAQIEAHLSVPDFNVEALADALALSRQQLHRRLVTETEATPVAYLRQYRLDRAAALLSAKEGSIAEVAYAVGFNSQSYFGKCFRAQFGESPSTFVQQQSEPDAP